MQAKMSSFFLLAALVAGIARAQSIPAQLLWDYSTGGPVTVVASFPDVNGDGRPDLLAGSADSLVYCLSGGGPDDAREIWSCRAQGAITDVEGIGDVNADGYPDAVAGSRDNLVYCISGRPADGGLELWTRADSATIHSVAALGDVNGDQIGDVVVGTAMNNLICISGAAAQQGKILWQYGSDADFWNVIAMPDLNGDGKKECAGSCDNFIYCFSGAGVTQGQQGGTAAKAVWAAPYDAGARVWSIAPVADVNGDGKADLLLGSNMDRVECLSGATGKPIWSFTTGADAVCVTAIGDINGDGKMDVLAGSSDDYGYALSGATGQQIWRVKFGSTVLSAAAIGDINSDGYPEAVFGSDADEVFCISSGGTTKGQKLWSYTATGGISSLAAIGDVNLNGITDVAAASTDSYLRLFEGNSKILDVELLSFTTAVQSAGVLLTWRTVSESNNLGFEVQRSFNGRTFEALGFVPGSGTTVVQNDYSWFDEISAWELLYYRLKQVDRDGQSQYFPAVQVVQNLPGRLTLHGNYPNPFNAGTFIRYDLPVAGEVIATIYNVRGEQVRELWHGVQPAGSHSLHWDGSMTSGEAAASGVYLCVITAGKEIAWLRISYLK
ncbi:MAG TPA: FlgD immunoglobulin-like domain containing protein [bacterium]|nr:FlgD immunoglobulin-like domain containing protein [bacterium]HPR89207.1 FlgD immunoglobulin-like domain containing protein [bacterium]